MSESPKQYTDEQVAEMMKSAYLNDVKHGIEALDRLKFLCRSGWTEEARRRAYEQFPLYFAATSALPYVVWI